MPSWPLSTALRGLVRWYPRAGLLPVGKLPDAERADRQDSKARGVRHGGWTHGIADRLEAVGVRDRSAPSEIARGEHVSVPAERDRLRPRRRPSSAPRGACRCWNPTTGRSRRSYRWPRPGRPGLDPQPRVVAFRAARITSPDRSHGVRWANSLTARDSVPDHNSVRLLDPIDRTSSVGHSTGSPIALRECASHSRRADPPFVSPIDNRWSSLMGYSLNTPRSGTRNGWPIGRGWSASQARTVLSALPERML